MVGLCCPSLYLFFQPPYRSNNMQRRKRRPILASHGSEGVTPPPNTPSQPSRHCKTPIPLAPHPTTQHSSRTPTVKLKFWMHYKILFHHLPELSGRPRSCSYWKPRFCFPSTLPTSSHTDIDIDGCCLCPLQHPSTRSGGGKPGLKHGKSNPMVRGRKNLYRLQHS